MSEAEMLALLSDREALSEKTRHHLTQLTHEQVIAVIENVQYLRDLASLELARRGRNHL